MAVTYRSTFTGRLFGNVYAAGDSVDVSGWTARSLVRAIDRGLVFAWPDEAAFSMADVIPIAQKGAVNGVAGLDADAYLLDANIPPGIARDSEVATAVQAAVDALVNAAPGTLNTLGEIATALAADESGAAALATLVGTLGTRTTALEAIATGLATTYLKRAQSPQDGALLAWSDELDGPFGLDPDEIAPPLRLQALAVATQAKVNAGMSDDGEMAVYIPESGDYYVQALLEVEGPTSADFKCTWTVPSGASMRWTLYGPNTTTSGDLSTAATGYYDSLPETGIGKMGCFGPNNNLADGTTTASSTTVGSATGLFNANDVGKTISGGSIPAGATIVSITSATAVVISAAATATASAVALTIGTRVKYRTRGWVVGQLSATGPGVLRMQFAQNVTVATDATNRLPGSRLIVDKLATANIPVDGNSYTIMNNVFTLQSPGKDYSFAINATRDYTRHEIRDGDSWRDGRQRCELGGPRYLLDTDLWVAFSFRFNGLLVTDNAFYVILNQIQQRSETGESGKPPSFALELTGKKLRVRTDGDAAVTTTSPPAYTVRWTEATDYVQNTWRNVVYRIKPHWTHGELDVWIDGTQVLNLTNILCGYNDSTVNARPRVKCGLYRGRVASTHVSEIANFEASTSTLFARVAAPLALPSFP